MSNVAFLNGELLDASQARISVWDGGWLHGAGLFETMRASNGHIFRLDAHLDRMTASARELLFPIERPDLPLTSDFQALLARNELSDARVRLTVTAGPTVEGGAGATVGDGRRPPLTVCVTVAPVVPYPPELRSGGMAVSVCPYKVSPDDPVAGHKCTSYLPRLLALRDAQAKHCGEALWFTTANLLAEGSISNVFTVKEGSLATPPVDTPVLPGITRAVVLELAASVGIEVKEKPLAINELLDADEVFITNSIMEVMPVCRVERREIGKGRPGPVVLGMAKEYRQLVERECAESGNEK